MFKRFGFDPYIFTSILVLSVLGIITIYNSSAIPASEMYGNSYYFLIRHIIYTSFGFFLMILIATTPSKIFLKKSSIYLLYIFTLLLLIVVLKGPIINGTQRWIRFGKFSFQPSELAKLSIILFLSYYLSSRKDDIKKGNLTVLLVITFAIGFFVFLISKEPDIGTALLIAGISLAMLFIGGISLRLLFISSAVLIGSAAVIGFFYRYVIVRIKTLIDYTSDPQGAGFQIIQSLIALGSGGLTGVGIANSTQKLYFLPYAYTDFIFSIIGEELGFIAAVAVLLLYFTIFIRGALISFRVNDFQKHLLSAGITIYITVQALINIAVVTGSFIPKGIPLPFVSYGGSSLIVSYIAAGILLNVSNKGLR